MTGTHENADTPQVSVITVVFNGKVNLEHCLQSVRGQVGVRIEHVVIDGGSTDGTVEIIRQHAPHLAGWISERDSGIGDAMNKGIARARGEWLLFLHADDYLLAPGSLAGCWSHLVRSKADVVAFPIRFGVPESFQLRRPRGGGSMLNFKTGIWHQASFIRRELFQRIGPYDTGLRIAMDYEFFLRAWRAGARFELLEQPVPTFMRSTGVSSRLDWRSLQQRFGEERQIHFRHARGFWARSGYRLYWPAYLTYRGLRFVLAGRGGRAQNPAGR